MTTPRAALAALRAVARTYVEARDAYVECDDDPASAEPCQHWHDQHEAFDALRAALAAEPDEETT